MSNCRVHIENQLVSLSVDQQHISRITYKEARDLVLQLPMFSNRAFRDDIQGWLDKGKIAAIAEFLSPEDSEQQKAALAEAERKP